MLVDTSVTIYNGSTPIDYVYQGSTLLWQKEQPTTGQPNNEIWYTSTDGNVVSPATIDFGTNLISNIYTSGKGVIKFDGNVTKIGTKGFMECTKLYTISLPESVSSIETQAFSKCSGLSQIELPYYTSIASTVFYLTGLSSIYLKDGNTITIGIFQNCSRLQSVSMPAYSAIPRYFLYQCTALNNITYRGTMAQWNAATKGTGWNTNVPATVVHCTDGDVTL